MSVMLAGMLAGCSGLGAVNLATPNAPAVAQGVNYSPRNDQQLDVYRPDSEALQSRSLPTVVFLYGGGWRSGTREKYKFVASGLTRLGYMVVIPDMRKHPEVGFPDFANDAADAVLWTFRNIGRLGGDPQRVFLMGHSSGAHTAALIQFDERYLQSADDGPGRLCGMVGLAGPYDFLPLVSPELQDIFPAPLRVDSQPVNFVSGDAPPALLIHGLHDQTVKPRNSAALHERIVAAGGESQLRIYDDAKHAALVLALSSTFSFLVPVLDDVQDFITAQSCGGGSPR